MLADDVVESPWPVIGSILVVEDVAYVCGGRITGLDGGLCLAAIDAKTGRKQWIKQVGRVYEKKLKTGATNNPNGYWKKPYGPTEGQMTSSILVYAGGDELRLYEQDFCWRFSRKDGSFILVDSGTGYPHSHYTKELPFHTFGRIDLAGIMAGRSVSGQFLVRGGMVLSFPEPEGVGLAFAHSQKWAYMLMGCRPEGVRWVRGYEKKEGGIPPKWGPITCDIRASAVCTAGDKGFLVGQPLIRPEKWRPDLPPPEELQRHEELPEQTDCGCGASVAVRLPPGWQGARAYRLAGDPLRLRSHELRPRTALRGTDGRPVDGVGLAVSRRAKT